MYGCMNPVPSRGIGNLQAANHPPRTLSRIRHQVRDVDSWLPQSVSLNLGQFIPDTPRSYSEASQGIQLLQSDSKNRTMCLF